MKEARSAVAAARHREVSRWAPDEMREAEAVLQEALDLRASAADRSWLFREAGAGVKGFARAHSLALHAMRSAVDRRSGGGRRAAAVLAEAARALREAEEIGLVVPLSGVERDAVRTARLDLAVCRSLFDEGDYLSSAARGAKAAAAARGILLSTGERAARYGSGERVRTWNAWIRETVETSRRTDRPAIVVVKELNELILYRGGREVRRFEADMGSNSLARKIRQGDNATPEGRYRVIQKKDLGQSRYHRALLLDYPTDEDRARLREAIAAGRVPPESRPGGAIEIHGEGGRGSDWTEGCVALSNADMDRLFGAVRVGTPVTIVGGDGRKGKFSSISADGSGDPSPDGEQ